MGQKNDRLFPIEETYWEKVKDGVGYKHLKLLERSQSYLIA